MKHHDDFGGLQRDLGTMSRRGMLRLLVGGAALGACKFVSVGDEADVDASTTTTAAASGTCAEIPEETPGPYPADGTNGPDSLTLSGIERSDIRTSIGTATGTAAGIQLTVTLTLVDTATCTPLVGYAIYLWHCDRAGSYSMYAGDAVNENYLRGVQETDDNGQVTFVTIFPACYSGRWPHMHLEVYASVASATSGANKLAVSQLAMPEATAKLVYVTTGYAASTTNLAAVSLATDNVFGDGASLELVTCTGSVTAGLATTQQVAIAV